MIHTLEMMGPSRESIRRATAANSGNNGAPSFDMAQLKLGERISCGRSTVLLTVRFAASAAGKLVS